MAVDFSAFDKKVDLDALQEEVKNAEKRKRVLVAMMRNSLVRLP